ncbi:MAG: PadR family transcriptional regulator [Actinobacteria bacterium]|nr:PadR family transcriptional regulator [Actinomycetota bacterium]
MSVTRLLVLGAVRIFQPAHGYLIRQELISWHADEWAHLNPGSVYNALRSLTRGGLLSEVPVPPAEPVGPAARAAYRITPAGEEEFLRLLRQCLVSVRPYQPEWLQAGIAFAWALPRHEMLDALVTHRHQLEARLAWVRWAEQDICNHPLKPALVVEQFRLHEAHLTGELAWLEAVSARIEAGEYGFDGEDPARIMPTPGRADRRTTNQT